MNSTKRFLAILAATAACALPARAYDNVITHTQMTASAVQKSNLYQDGSIMFNLGLLPSDRETFDYHGRLFLFFRWGAAQYSTAGIIAEGAFDEDSGITVRHHFFDPHFNTAYISDTLNHKSWEWALEEPATDAFQDWSLRDTRAYLNRALTYTDGSPEASSNLRRLAMRNMFLGLGHVMHHIQDMAQPQHVRSDSHFEVIPGNPWLLRWIQDPSRYEQYTMDRSVKVNALAHTATPLDLSNGQFRIARDFWFNPAHTGMAELTNQQFVSQDSNFIEGVSVGTKKGHPLPVARIGVDFTVQALYDGVGESVPAGLQEMCGTPAINCTMNMVATDTTPRASTLSIFNEDLKRNNIEIQWGFPPVLTRVLYSLNRFNFDAQHVTLIPRAVSYSAGFLNHFFRGKFEVMRPVTGAWAVVDHGTSDGFREIRARVMNASGEEALSQGKLRAIARFHRNNCYQSDLSGEFRKDSSGNLITPCPAYRSQEEHLRMTAVQDVAFDVGETKEMTFTFSDPIPFDATDLILQVYYEGTVGIELDGFALGAADLSEPTYYTVMNATDIFEVNAAGFYYPNEIITGIQNAEFPFTLLDSNNDQEYDPTRDVDIRGGNVAYEISLDGKKFGDALLPEGRFARIAALVSPFGAQLTLIARGNGFNSIRSYQLSSKMMQYDPVQNAFIVSVVDTLRSQALHFNSVTFYHYWPTFGAPLKDMRESKADSATTPIPVEPAP